MSDYDIFKKIIIPQSKLKGVLSCPKPSGSQPKAKAILEEGKYRVTINEVPPEVLVIKADSLKIQNLLLNCDLQDKGNFIGLCKCADYILISTRDKIIFYIELKSKYDVVNAKKQSKKKKSYIPINGKTELENKIIRQLKGAECLIHYFRAVGQVFLDKNFLDDYNFRYVGIIDNTIKLSKNLSKDKGENPENFLRVEVNSGKPIPFNELIQ